MPTNTCTPYFFFKREERPKLVAVRPRLKIGEVLAAKWNKLGASERQSYQVLAEEDRVRYYWEIRDWNEMRDWNAKKVAKKVAKQVAKQNAKQKGKANGTAVAAQAVAKK
jgi:hypothetical protein